jgi:hypothetical protein
MSDSGYTVRGRIVEWDAGSVRENTDVLKAWDAINADVRIEPGSGLLIDNKQSSFNVPGDAVEQLAQELKRRLPKIKTVAILVSSNLHFGMARQFQTLADDALDIQVFRDLDTARRWLAERTASPRP